MTSSRRIGLALLLILASSRAGLSAQTGLPTPLPAERPSPDDVLARHLEARGGADAWNAITALRRISTGPMELSAAWRRSDGYRMDESDAASGFALHRLVTRDTAWASSSVGGRYTMSAAEQQALREEAVFGYELLVHESLGLEVTVGGQERVGDRPAWRLDLVFASGYPMTVFLDAETWLEVRRVRQVIRPDGERLTHVTELRDHRPVAGVLMPHQSGPASFTWQVNDAVPAALFSGAPD